MPSKSQFFLLDLRFLGDSIARFLAAEKGFQIGDRPKAHGLAGLDRCATDMRQQEYVVEFAVAGMNSVGLAVKDVEAGSADAAAAERFHQRVVIDNTAARGIESGCIWASRSRFSSPRVDSVAGQ